MPRRSLLFSCLIAMLLPVLAHAQAPVFLFGWGVYGTGGGGGFNQPYGVAIDPDGNVFVTDPLNLWVERFEHSGTFTVQWGGSSVFRQRPQAIATSPSGLLYVADSQVMHVFSSWGEELSQWPYSYLEAYPYPSQIAFDAAGDVYIADAYNQNVEVWSPDGRTMLRKWGTQGSGNGQFVAPEGIAVDAAGYVYVTDGNNHRIQKFTSNGTYVAQWGSLGSGDGQFNYPRGLAIDHQGRLYVADTGNNRIQVFDLSGHFLLKWGSAGSANGQFYYPWQLTVDAQDHVYVVDSYNNRIQVFGEAPTPTATSTWGSLKARYR